MSDFKIGDAFGRGWPFQNLYFVVELNEKERMVKVQAESEDGRLIGKPFWKKNTSSLFSRKIG